MEIQKKLKEKYDGYYKNIDKSWRMNGAIAKADNILTLVNGNNYSKLIEVGAGDGSILSILSKTAIAKELYALEISESGIEAIKTKDIAKLSEIKLFDGYSIPYPDSFFDVAICSHVIEHVEHPRLLLREIKRISKQQIFEVPIDFSFNVDKKALHYLNYGHINIYTPALFRFLLLSENFKIKKDLKKMYPFNIVIAGNESLIKKTIKVAKWIIFKLFKPLLNVKPHSYAVFTE